MSAIDPALCLRLGKALGLPEDVKIAVRDETSMGWVLSLVKGAATISRPIYEVSVSALSGEIKRIIGDCPWLLD